MLRGEGTSQSPESYEAGTITTTGVNELSRAISAYGHALRSSPDGSEAAGAAARNLRATLEIAAVTLAEGRPSSASSSSWAQLQEMFRRGNDTLRAEVGQTVAGPRAEQRSGRSAGTGNGERSAWPWVLGFVAVAGAVGVYLYWDRS
jgi:hypothetical protein